MRFALAFVVAGFAFPVVAEEFSGRVVGVTDGDTIRVLRNDVEVKVRLVDIDCPESKQPFGARSKQATSALVFGKVVTVKVKGTDRYNRLLADVGMPNGENLNRELVKSGFAWWYRKYSDDESLGALESEARNARRGLWEDEHPIPPWEWRRKPKSRQPN